ncbi:MAG: protein BatD [Chitinophagaceae bacterium]|nr:MAG: protein BatD [Chitinophagaceae bacterium]
MVQFLQRLFFAVLFLAAWPAMAQTKFSAQLSPAEIAKNEYTTLRIVIQNASNINSLSQPDLKDFIVVSGPNQESGMNNINGQVTQYLAVSYILQPRRPGNFVLPALKANLDGKTYNSAPLKVKVNHSSRAAASPAPYAAMSPRTQQRQTDFTDFILKPGERIPEKINRNMQLRLETNKTSCYVGEPIVASYKLYTRLRSESRLTKNPSFNGFSVIDLQQPDVTDFERGSLNGRDYNVYTIRKAQLYPLQDGTIELETATLENNVLFLTADAAKIAGNVQAFINGQGFATEATVTQRLSLTSQPVTIKVKPLPLAGKPASFSGAVGSFNLSASLPNQQLTTAETGRLQIIITGQGNLQLVTAPEIKWPDGLEAFDVAVTEELEQTAVPVSGRKIFEVPFTVSKEGNYEIPAIEFSYFDPASGSYKTSSTKPIGIAVSKSNEQPAVYVDAPASKPTASFAATMFNNRIWMVGAVGSLIALGILFWLRADKKKKQVVPQPIGLPKLPEEDVLIEETVSLISNNPLWRTEQCLRSEDCTDFYTLLNLETKNYLAIRFNLAQQDVSAKRISAAMDKAGIDNDICLQTQELLQEIEWQLYTPFERNDTMEPLYNRAQDLVRSIHTCNMATR